MEEISTIKQLHSCIITSCHHRINITYLPLLTILRILIIGIPLTWFKLLAVQWMFLLSAFVIEKSWVEVKHFTHNSSSSSIASTADGGAADVGGSDLADAAAGLLSSLDSSFAMIIEKIFERCRETKIDKDGDGNENLVRS